jgi:hypothetical protein
MIIILTQLKINKIRDMKKKYIYSFTWMDENGDYCGWNDVQAESMGEARKEARKNETKAHWALYDSNVGKYITVPNEVKGEGHCFYNKGMYIDPKSFKRTSMERHLENHRMAAMMAR